MTIPFDVWVRKRFFGRDCCLTGLTHLSFSFKHLSFVTNPPHLLRDDDAIGNAINAVNNNLQQPQQMINNAPQNAAQQEVV